MTTANKALLGALLAALTSIVADLRGADSSLTFQDWVVTILAALVTGIGVYTVPNYTRGGVRKEGGASTLATVLIVAGALLIVADLLFAQVYVGVGLGVLLLLVGVVLAATGR
jgi:hypothetical protein